MVKLECVIRRLDIDQTIEPAFTAPVENTVSKSTIDLRSHIRTAIIDGHGRTVGFWVELQGRRAGKMLVGVNQNVRCTVISAARGRQRAGRESAVLNYCYTEKQSRRLVEQMLLLRNETLARVSSPPDQPDRP